MHYLSVLIVFLRFSLNPIDDGCAVSTNYSSGDVKEPQPLILMKEKNRTDFLHPFDAGRVLRLKTGRTVLLACPGKGNHVVGINSSSNVNEIEAECLRGKTFLAGSRRFDFTSVSCRYLPRHEARRTGLPCHGNDTHVEIGFPLKESFLRTIEICRSDRTMMTTWAKFRLTSRIAAYQSSYPRPRVWQVGNFYKNYDVQYRYKPATQLKAVELLLGSSELAKKYIRPEMSLFMARGHLTAKADFVYGSAQMSTFWYLNSAPQWQTFNAGNWNSLEGDVRSFVANRTSDVEVYTGTHGQMSLDDVNGNPVPVYLYVNGTDRAFPVPKFFWKVIHDPATKRATAFVGVNDPWAEKITEDMFLCEDIAEKVKWLTWRADNLVKGVSYACTVDDLRKSVPTVPLLSVNNILV